MDWLYIYIKICVPYILCSIYISPVYGIYYNPGWNGDKKESMINKNTKLSKFIDNSNQFEGIKRCDWSIKHYLGD